MIGKFISYHIKRWISALRGEENNASHSAPARIIRVCAYYSLKSQSTKTDFLSVENMINRQKEKTEITSKNPIFKVSYKGRRLYIVLN